MLKLIFSLIVIPASLRYLERLWGSTETVKFVVVTIVASNIIAFVANWLEYTVTKMPAFLCVIIVSLRILLTLGEGMGNNTMG